MPVKAAAASNGPPYNGSAMAGRARLEAIGA
jgi:hypothetical protein